MGIDLSIKNNLRDAIAPTAFRPVAQWDRRAGPYGIVVDYLTRYKALSRLDAYTTPELFQRFWADAARHLVPPDSPCLACVYVSDDRRNVTRHKAETQHSRVTAAIAADERKGLEAARPYPADATLCAEGVDMGAEGVERIDLRRLDVSRSHMGTALYDAFFPYIQRVMRGVQAPRSFVFDFQHEGPWVFSGSERPQFVTDARAAHNLGEADPALVWWVHFFRRTISHMHIFTCDTDLIPIWCLYEAKHGASSLQSVFWHPNPEVMVDLRDMAERIRHHWRTVPQALQWFAVGCMVAGTDIMHKKHYAHGFNAAKILSAAMSVAVAHPSPSLRVILEQLYYDTWLKALPVAPALPLPRAPTLEDMRATFEHHPPKDKRVRFPSSEDVEKWEAKLAFNCMYWEQAVSR